MANFTQKDFSAGWRPSDDFINGAPNGLLQMDNVDLDTNGAISLIGGTSLIGSAYGSNLHTLYSRTMGGTRRIYSADTGGAILRDNTSIGTGGDSAIAAFGTAFNYVLACSGNTRKKDDGTTAVNLGVGAPTAAFTGVTADLDVFSAPSALIASLISQYAMYTGTATIVTETDYPSGGGHIRPSSIKYLQLTADANGKAVFQTYSGTGDPHDGTALVSPYSGTGSFKDSDVIPFYGYIISPWGKSLQIDILLTAGNAYADQMNNYYTYKIDDLSTLEFDPYTGVFHVFIKRSDFTKVGTSGSWAATYGVRISFSGGNGEVINILGNTLTPTGGVNVLYFFGGTLAQNGVYEFAQMNVNNTGSYLAKSPLGPVTRISIINSQLSFAPQNPSGVDSQVNEVWIFARSTGAPNGMGVVSTLNDWYRVAVFTSSLGSGKQIAVDDLTALRLNIKYNRNLTTIASSGIADKILSIVGPINKRWYYFTTNMMYPSDIDNPDLVDTTTAIRTTGSNNEIFLWAKQVDKATVLVGTSVDVYVLSGTFATLPDNTIDIYYHGLGCKYPPIAYDADVFSGGVFYMANDGPRVINVSGTNDTVSSPQTDRLYRGLTSNGYTAPNLKVAPGSIRFPIIVGKNKLWIFVTGTGRYEVFDFTRKYWRTANYALGDTTAVCSTQDGQVLGFYSIDKRLRELEVTSTKKVDGTTNQSVRLLWPVTDCGLPRNRKDVSTFKARVYTNSSDLSVSIINENGAGGIVGALNSTSTGLDKFIDLSTNTYVNPSKTFYVSMLGSLPDFLLEDWVLYYEPRPDQVNYVKVLPNNFGNAGKKRIRNWPVVIDTLGNDVVWTPDVDNTAFATSTINSSYKATKNLFYTADAFGVDYGGTFHSTGLFEFYQMLSPVNVQTLPVAKRFDQIGPEDLFKYGKIKQFELRLLPEGSIIPYIFYFSDSQKYASSVTVTSGKEDSYFIDVPKGTSGRILRLVIGPTAFDFHRFYVRIQVAESGRDTELNWITIAGE